MHVPSTAVVFVVGHPQEDVTVVVVVEVGAMQISGQARGAHCVWNVLVAVGQAVVVVVSTAHPVGHLV